MFAFAGACVAKRAPEHCLWDTASLPPIVSSAEQEETESLRREVRRLQGLVNELGGTEQQPSLAGSPTSQPFGTPPHPERVHLIPVTEEESKDDLVAQDLAQKLGQLTISHFLQGQQETAKSDSTPLLREVSRVAASICIVC